ncbi:MAG: ATP-dependent sacrificial sulfur transferase LarE [Chthoniobacter sp.]|nr:ATP-dependent sacrificial sulfur transferase LarE [Chthoniobacter sp.]
MNEKLALLRAQLRDHAPLVIAYSGGVDSAYLLAEAHQTLGVQVLGVIADSASLPRQALAEALAVAEKIGARVEVVKTGELDNPDYASNPPNRCYFCKAELFTNLDGLARERGFRAIAYGENADDMKHDRPGRQAATEFAVLAPLRDAGLTKAEIRELSRELGLPTADAPAQPCLSSRIPWGTPVTAGALEMIERGEASVRALGFRVFRVRHIVQETATPAVAIARVQIAPEEMSRLPAVERDLTTALLEAGYAGVEIDPAGYRSPA